MTQHLFPGPTTAADISAPLIAMHQAVQDGWEPPDFISEDEYAGLREQSNDGEISPLIGFVGFGVSWGGKWWGGYARGDGRIYCLEAKKALLDKHNRMKHVTFQHANYKTLNPEGCLIYCDPPYDGTTGYGTPWDSLIFWDTVRKWSKSNTVLVSEYIAPADFEIIWSESHFSFSGTKSRSTKENLFALRR